MAVLSVGGYRRCRQQTYVLVSAAVTLLFLLGHYLSLDKAPDDGEVGRGTYVEDDTNSNLARRPMAASGQYEKAADVGATGSFSVDRFVEGGKPLTSEEMSQRNAEWKVDQALKMSIDQGSVVAKQPVGGGGDGAGEDGASGAGIEVPYLHCGPMHGLGVAGGGGLRGMLGSVTQSSPSAQPPREILLLHGARYTKEDWRTSGILDSLCLMGKGEDDPGSLSVTAIDLSVAAGPLELARAVDALRGSGVLSPHPVFVVSPSASGAAVVGLGEMAAEHDGVPSPMAANDGGNNGGNGSGEGDNDDDGEERRRNLGATRGNEPIIQGGADLLRRTVRGWIPVAAPAVLTTSSSALRAFQGASVPIMAVFGADDAMGKKSAARLVVEAGAFRTKLEGGHACYLDGPDGFVTAVLGFVEDACRQEEGGER